MEKPFLGMCGHLFDEAVLKKYSKCPLDQRSLADAIPLPGLRDRISHHSIGQKIAEDSYEKKVKEPEFGTIQATKEKVIKNVHLDDIHGLILSGKNIISGSKDNMLRMWDLEGKYIQPLRPYISSQKKGYEYWVTALSPLSNGLFASGTRNGDISIWDETGEELVAMKYNPSQRSMNGYTCKDRNKQRINCITEYSQSQNSLLFYTGTAKFIQLWDSDKRGIIWYHQASQNDWVYCIEVLENNNLIVVIGPDLEVWDMSDFASPKRSKVVDGLSFSGGSQRPHISSILRLPTKKEHLAAAFFDGSVRIVDLTSQKTVIQYAEHEKRVWSVIDVGMNLLASGADDKTIKIWDVRQKHSVCTLGGNPGRVSSLLKIGEGRFISGSCPDDLKTSKDKASFTFWNLISRNTNCNK